MVLAIRQYTQDYDERLPILETNNSGILASIPYGWAGLSLPYIESTAQFQCPSDQTRLATDANSYGTVFDESGSLDYFYNSRLSGVEKARVVFASRIIMLVISTPAMPATLTIAAVAEEYSRPERPAQATCGISTAQTTFLPMDT